MDSEHPEIEREFDLTEVERRLAAWRPATGALNRDRLLYDAGRAAARADGQSGSWRPATVALALVAALLGGLLANERSRCLKLETSLASASGTRPPQRRGEIELPAAGTAPAIEPFAPSSYFALSQQFSRRIAGTSAPDGEFEPEHHRPAGGRLDLLPQERPLQPRDQHRLLDL